MDINELALKKHKEWGGKIEIISRAEIESREDLAVYANHPEHVKVKQYIHKVLVNGISVDFED